MDFYNLGNHALALETSLWTTDIYFKDSSTLWYDYCHLLDLLNQLCSGSLACYLHSASFTTSLSLSLCLTAPHTLVVFAICAILLFYSELGGAWIANKHRKVCCSWCMCWGAGYSLAVITTTAPLWPWTSNQSSHHSLVFLPVSLHPAHYMCSEQQTTFNNNLIFIVSCLNNVCCHNVGVHANPCHCETGVRH